MKQSMSRVVFSVALVVVLGGCAAKPAPSLQSVYQKERATHEAFGKDYMVTTQGEWSTKAGQEIYKLGGNAVDAAAAVSFAISVERPNSTGIGGGGFMLIYLADVNKAVAIDFREKAPLKGHPKMFLDKEGNVIKGITQDGILSGGVPGLVAGVLDAQAKYGKLTREQVMAPAIRLAKEGFPMYGALAEAIDDRHELMQRFPASRKAFFKANGEQYKVGELFKQPDLAKTLQAIAAHGRDGFYKGWVAQAIVKEQRRLGGMITQRDLDQYEVKYREPIVGTYKGYEVYSMPPPSSGGVHIMQILNILENDSLPANGGPLAPRNIHLTASAMQMAFADRSKYLGDTDFVAVPVKGLTSKAYAKELRRQILKDKARRSSDVLAGNPKVHESDQTTHFTVMSGNGDTVASTQSVNRWMGSGVVVPGTGFLMNDQMDDFAAKPNNINHQGINTGSNDNNAVQPGKRPLSSMSPTIVVKNRQPVVALGSPGGARIITCVTLTLLNYLEYQMPLYDAVSLVRYDHQWTPDEIHVDAPFLPPATQKSLEKMGYTFNNVNRGCRIEAIARENDKLHGVADPRAEGASLGE